MKAENITFFDGHWYETGADLPDLGSFVAMPGSTNIRNYEGLETGSSAFCVDTGQLLKYEKTTKTWYETGA